MRYFRCAGRRSGDRRRHRASPGYTIIEVLISVAIFSAVVTLACAALDQGLKQYQRVAEKGVNFWDNAKLLWISKSFSSTMDYLVETKSAGIYPYFNGTQEMVSFVTASPFASDTPVVAWIRKEEDGNGNISLVYYELPVQTMKVEDIEKAYIFEDYKAGKSAVILSQITDLEYNFYGYDAKGAELRWASTYEGARTKRLPAAVTITYTDLQTGGRRQLFFGINTVTNIRTENFG